MKLKKTKERKARDRDGEHIYMSNVCICVLLASVHKAGTASNFRLRGAHLSQIVSFEEFRWIYFRAARKS